MAASRKPLSSPAASIGDHHRFLRPGALARLRDARLRRGSRTSRLPPAPASPPASPPPPPPAGDGDSDGVGAAMPYFVPVSRLLAPRCPQRKKLAAAKYAVLFSSPPPSADLPVDAVIEFLSSADMVVVAAH